MRAKPRSTGLVQSSALPDGGFVWAEPYAHRVRIVDPNGVVSTLAGTGEAGFAGDGGKATAAKLNFVHTAVPTADGGFLLADTWNSRVREISSLGIITTVAGTGVNGFAGDGRPASTRARISTIPRSVAPLADGGFLLPDSNNHRVRKVSASGTITTVAGTGAAGFSGDGAAGDRGPPLDSLRRRADGGWRLPRRRHQQRANPESVGGRDHHHRGGQRCVRVQRGWRPCHRGEPARAAQRRLAAGRRVFDRRHHERAGEARRRRRDHLHRGGGRYTRRLGMAAQPCPRG